MPRSSSFQAAVTAKSDYAEAHSSLVSILHSKGEIDAAIAEFQVAVAAKPYADAHFSIALSFEKKGNLEEAIAAWDRAIASKPAYPAAYFFRGGGARNDHLRSPNGHGRLPLLRGAIV
jgi:protein O-GlcNAc transferase